MGSQRRRRAKRTQSGAAPGWDWRWSTSTASPAIEPALRAWMPVVVVWCIPRVRRRTVVCGGVGDRALGGDDGRLVAARLQGVRPPVHRAVRLAHHQTRVPLVGSDLIGDPRNRIGGDGHVPDDANFRGRGAVGGEGDVFGLAVGAGLGRASGSTPSFSPRSRRRGCLGGCGCGRRRRSAEGRRRGRGGRRLTAWRA